MALTPFQRDVCRLLARHRVESGQSYVAGGAALNEALKAARVSRDVDVFHDTDEALAAAWDDDRRLLSGSGFRLRVLRERPMFVEAEVARGDGSVILQWVRDSAYRFFPLVADDDLGLVLHPFDLATNKVLALVGRLEVRDWVDVVECDRGLQPLGYLLWAASGKDPGFGPALLLEHAARSGRYSREEVSALAFDGPRPDAAELSRRWHAMLEEARDVIEALPPGEAGRCVLTAGGDLCRLRAAALPAAIERAEIAFHEGRIRGALPMLKGGV